MKTLLYCPMSYHHDRGVWPPTIPSTMYFAWQRNLLDFFNQQNDFKVIWNGFPTGLEDPIQYYESDMVKYTRWRINRALDNCDKVFADFPSTVVLDANLREKPVLCVALWDHDYLIPFPFVFKPKEHSNIFEWITSFMKRSSDPSQGLYKNPIRWWEKI